MSGVTADIPVPQARYALLHKDGKGCVPKNKLILLCIVSILAVSLTLVIYAATIGIYDIVLFPANHPKKDLPQHSINRAILYNTINYTNAKPAEELVYRKTKLLDTVNFKLVCYYALPSESSLRDKDVLLPNNLDAHLCTHINLAFGTIVNNSIQLDSNQISDVEKVLALKSVNKNLKVLLSIGGGPSATVFPEMVLNHENRKTFIKSIDYYIRKYKFDGIDLDWEFPNHEAENDKKQKVHFTQLLHEIRNEINRQDKHTFLLSVAVAAPFVLVDTSYDVSYMNEYVDYINIMSYDYHFFTTLTPYTGFNAPLYSRSGEGLFFNTLNINYSANYWFAKGMDKQKIVIGLPTYGHSFKLWNADNNGVTAPAKGYGTLGGGGFIDYKDVCWFLMKNQIKPFFDTDSKSPYATKYTEWISYDDQTSLGFKAEYIKNNNFGGAMIFSLNSDDHQGYCNPEGPASRFPLTHHVKTILNDQQL